MAGINEENEDKYRFPLGVTADEEDDNNVRVCIVVRGIKKAKLSFDKSKPDNGTLKIDLKDRSLDVIIELDLGDKDKNGKPKIEKFRYQVKQLPDRILPSECKHKVKKDQVVLMLKKEKERSWSRELSTGGLETFREPDSDDSDAEDKPKQAEALDTITE